MTPPRSCSAMTPRAFRLMLGTLLAEESPRSVAGIGGISAVVSKRDRPEVIVAASPL